MPNTPVEGFLPEYSTCYGQAVLVSLPRMRSVYVRPSAFARMGGILKKCVIERGRRVSFLLASDTRQEGLTAVKKLSTESQEPSRVIWILNPWMSPR